MKRVKTILYPLLAFGSIFLVGQYALNDTGQTNSFLRTSFVHVLQELAKASKPDPADLAIEKVTLRKVAEPSDDFEFYKYYATVVLINKGGYLENAQVILNGKDQKHMFVRNGDGDFNLAEGQRYIIDKYEVLFDGAYNGGDIILNLEVKNGEDVNKENNSFKVNILELPAKIQSIAVEDLLDDGSFGISFEPESYSVYADDFQIMVSEEVKSYDLEEQYSEIYSGSDNYGYNLSRTTGDVLNDNSFKEKNVQELEAHYIRFDDNPFDDEETRYVYIKATNPENGYFAVSNVLKFSPQQGLNRAEFAKLFVESADVELDSSGLNLYEDVAEDSVYAPYIQTLYNAGVLNVKEFSYRPEDPINRAEALRVVMDYFKADLKASNNDLRFEDMNIEDAIYPYIEGLFDEGKGSAFSEYFQPEGQATKNYIKYLINEFA